MLKRIGKKLAAGKLRVAKKIPVPVKKAWGKLPSETRKGMAIGAMVPVPGAMSTGGLAGTAVWGGRKGKDAIEGAVRRKTGLPYRLFAEKKPGMGRYEPGVKAVEASPKLDGVYARATREGVFSKSGKPLAVPHVQKRLARYFRKHPEGALEGELYRKKAGIESIAGEARAGGEAAKRLKLHMFPGQADRPWPLGAVRRVKGTAVKDDSGVEKVYRKALRKGHEGVVVRDAAGKKYKRKPQEDREWPVGRVAGGKRGVLELRGDDGKPFRVQSAGGVQAKQGDQVSVRHSGLTKRGKPKAAVAYRVRNDHDFSTIPMNDKEQEQLKKDRRSLVRGAVAGGLGIAGGLYLLKKGGGAVVRDAPKWTGGGRGLPSPAVKLGGRGNKVTKTREVIRMKHYVPTAAKVDAVKVPVKASGPGGTKGAAANSARKFGPAGAQQRVMKAAGLKEKRAWGALRPASATRLSKTTPGTREQFAKLDAKARAKVTPREAFRPGGEPTKSGMPRVDRKQKAQVTAREARVAARAEQERARQELLAFRRKKNFETPAGRLIEFNNGAQWKTEEGRRYGNPLKGAAGLERGYYRNKADGTPKIEDLPLAHAQVLKSAYNKGKKVQQVATRGASLGKDVVDTVRGKPRAKDAAGRTKKKEWEKGWFKNTVKNVATGGALLAGTVVLKKNPKARRMYRQVERWGAKKANQVSANFTKGFSELREFATPASGLFRDLRGASKAQRAAVASRKALLGRVKAKAAAGSDKAGWTRNVLDRHVKMKEAKIKNIDRRQKVAVRQVKKGAVVAGGAALAGGAAMKLRGDQKEGQKVRQGARFRNALVGAAAGSFLGGGLAGGRSGFRGARVGAALGGLVGAVTNPKRRVAIDELQTASFEEMGGMGGRGSMGFETPAGRLISFDAVASDAGWDIRDPRGRSARVFAPGSRRRERREKEWYEKADNERKLWKAGVVAAGVAGLAGGAMLGRKLGKKTLVRKPRVKPGKVVPISKYAAG